MSGSIESRRRRPATHRSVVGGEARRELRHVLPNDHLPLINQNPATLLPACVSHSAAPDQADEQCVALSFFIAA
jgi:hypothetical protein